MAAGLPRFRSFPASCATASRPMTPWQKPRRLPSVPWPSALSNTNRVPSKSTFPFPSPRESVAVHQGQAFACGIVWHRVETQTAIWFSPHVVPGRLARCCLRVSRRRRNWPQNACSSRKAYGHHSKRFVVPPAFPVVPEPSVRGTLRIEPREAGYLKHWRCRRTPFQAGFGTTNGARGRP